MPTFDYRAEDARGRRCRGRVEADSPRHARQLLRERGLLPSELLEVREQLTTGSRRVGVRLSSADLALLTLQLSTLIQAGLPLEEVLGAVAQQSQKRRVAGLLAAVRSRVMEGHALATAMGAFPQAFTELYCATIAAGEQSGHLGQVLAQLASYTEARQASRQRIQLALVYPLILMLACVAIVSFLLGYVVPDVVKIFVDSGQPLPWLTQAMIALSDGLRRYGLLMFGALAGMVGLWRWSLRQPTWRLRWHRLFLKLPVAGNVLRTMEAARFASTLAILSKSAVPLVDALHIAAQVIGNLTIRARMADVARSVREGGTLTRGLQLSGDIPPLMLHMIASGERAGELDNMLARAAEQQEANLAARIALVVSLFEPAMLVVMGGVVLLIVMAILLPILSLNQLVN
ncbi:MULTISPECIES: type II secretion system inner membrane protein GspF [unclassified Pseudomonas]|uniref:type II secretion system inner membrane protein GspF n=1 Tax=unclassified Pseudomonas TaxID=196821 RepID=UPI00119C12F4|nr:MULTISPECIES: type II secretion system inner membrane protein GspF [unclassified Pseudomonas]TWC10537.1 general secretion pathway protein F [Pseudomonas sp. SJZ075]TWC26692.1 general secretion pathway protein F [Pseudomonas sp. SJZ078]TWC45851.1 general secretion pathway protein F [Pseudomonas sp. SJZ124]TWC46116.1 general secretion pathway protein F [Pseudomonas sp. SJZ080]TWC81134.1 general secretion pathway protein F [Pseudomonas sp. SJZ101]